MSHFKGRLTYHMVLATKYRKKSLAGLEEEVYRSLRALAAKPDAKFKVVEAAVEDGDHLHLVLELSQTVSPDQVVRRVKQVTTFDLWESSAAALGRFYWGGKRRLWSGGYYCATVGDVSRSKVLAYVRKQGRPLSVVE